MTRKQEIIVGIRDALYGMMNGCISVLRIVLLSRPPSKFHFPQELPPEALILGNGPSLGPFMEKHSKFIQQMTRICVNHYVMADAYETVKPQIYLISSPEFFLKDEIEAFAKRKELTLVTIAQKTQWPLVLYVPMFAKSIKGWQRHFDKHPYISIAYFNNTPVEGFLPLNLWALRRQLGMPRPHNVVVPCIAIAIYIGYKKIYLAGVEHSWLKELSVDEDNEVLLSQKHFYDKEAAKLQGGPQLGSPQPMYKGIKSEKRKLHEILEKFYLSFKSYWEIKPYAKDQNVEVINLTTDSYIDAFEKRSVPEVSSISPSKEVT